MAWWSRRSWLAVVFAVGVSCLSPTLPLPPPSEPDVSGPDEQGLVTLKGKVRQPRALVEAQNLRTETVAGKYADGEGAYEFQIAARVGDPLELWYEYAFKSSDRLAFDVPGARDDAGVPLTMSPPSITGPDAAGVVVLSGVVPRAGAEVIARVQRTGALFGNPADGSGAYRIELEPVVAGDVIEVWFELNGIISEHLTVVAGEDG